MQKEWLDDGTPVEVEYRRKPDIEKCWCGYDDQKIAWMPKGLVRLQEFGYSLKEVKASGRTLCCYCALPSETELCPAHTRPNEEQNDTWAEENRIYGNWLHRNKSLPDRLPPEERNSDARKLLERIREEDEEDIRIIDSPHEKC